MQEMIEIKHEQVGNVPYLNVYQAEQEQKRLPTVFFYHGFQSQKELYLHYGYYLAEKGFRVILPEAAYHGERKGDAGTLEQTHFFWDAIQGNIDEFAALKESLIQSGQTDIARIGVGGVSMGAITSLGILNRYEDVHAVVSLMGSAYYVDYAKQLSEIAASQGITFPYSVEERIARLAPYDLTKRLDRIGDRPVLLWHGKKDDVVPYIYSERLYQSLVEQQLADNVEFISDENAKHKVTLAGIEKTVAFFTEQLGS